MKVYIVEALSHDDYERVAVCASLERAAQVLKAEAEDGAQQLTKYVHDDITWDEDGLGFYAGRTRYQIVETEVLQ